MAKINSILTVDIGGDNLKVAEFVYPPEGGMVLTGFKFLAYDAELKESKFNEAFKIAFNEAITSFSSRSCRITISGQNSFSRLSKLPPLGNDKKGLNQIVNFEARQTVPYPIEEVVWDYQLIHHEVEIEVQSEAVSEDDADDEITAAPEKTKVKKEEIEALFVAVKKDLITDLTNAVQQAGVEVLSVEIAPVATFNALRGNQIGLDQCDLVLNIGGRSSSLIIADGNCMFIRSIPIAGQTITQQIAKEFNISLADAEDMKIRHGFVALGGAYEEADSEVASMVSKMARNVMTRLHGEVNRSINMWRSQHGGNKPKRLFLCGGGSLMPYTPLFFEEKLRLPVEYLNAFPIVTIDPSVNKDELLNYAPMFSEMIGMSLRHILKQCPVEITLTPPSLVLFKDLQAKRPYFLGCAVSIMLCLLVFYWAVDARREADTRKIESAKTKIEQLESVGKRVDASKRRLDGVIGEYRTLIDLLAERKDFVQIFNELQQIVPNMMWLTSITFSGKVDSGEEGLPGKRGPMSSSMPRGMMPAGMGGVGGMAGMSGMGGMGGMGMNSAAVTGDVGTSSYKGASNGSKFDSGELEYVTIEGHTVVLDNSDYLPGAAMVWESLLAPKLSKSDYLEESDIAPKYNPARPPQNLTSFQRVLKLKKPIKK